MVRPGRDLRQVRDREDLMMRGNASHRVADLEADTTADACVDLVEDERRHAIRARQDRLEREHHARELAA